MEQAAPVREQSKTRYSTLLGFLFKTILMLMLLSALAWLWLIAWFGLHAVFSVGYTANSQIRGIIDSQFAIVAHHHAMIVIQNKIYSAFNFIAHFHVVKEIVSIIVGVTEIIIVRLGLFILSIPVFAVLLFVLIVDGLVQRDIRKFQAARESTFFFHRLKPLAGMSLYVLYFVYMAMPIALSPELFLLLMAFLTGLFSMLSIKNFKKYA